MPYRIALTGGIATGKSTVAKYLRSKGYQVIDTDQIARKVVKPGSPGLEALVVNFGSEILDDSGELHRKKLAEKVFSDKQLLNQLNEIMHPLIFNELEKQIQLYAEPIIFIEVPLLYETEKSADYDEVWLIYASHRLQLKRLMSRDLLSEALAKDRIHSQWPIEDKVKWADRVISSETTIQQMHEQVDDALQKVLNKL
ncbi:dephospho-CoA kinase [Facklamia sp. DSM 111018]|uniref:Dephospho-CoA kinase n=1 Tax=Facklamia lactis TaxID=2749967 RepID=A0ABS0LRP6_9LACT|nr:dephospho-CoA kinase [Facklamia lactis]MBG9980884.1 dephospho-CoA kinase [Facklamia lactis]MBG9986753.1 dephospho-CoA kinase [Facklamia lactis]